ncbi:arginase family protein [Acinetobacter qingfengensis]|uniref:Arginase n=1 Tax=Acinetobacter qingfengensis TaxID=1262585 RepID=A0A1E7R398_9GAMM|nr:arginase family protein [Acinetobacter qingfengensis]KAA8734814.1 arginase family protein [Acinetobacter qingfengensis]OEY93810.1 arginase [Acinetobacter qingfengensis]
MSSKSNLRLIFPQWQGGDNPPYYLGSKLLAWLAPPANDITEEVNVIPPANQSLVLEDGMTGRVAVTAQLADAARIIAKHKPDTLTVLGGDCLVSLAPFAWLSEHYGNKLGVLWIDSHPDVQTPAQYPNAHAHVLGALLGHGDKALTDAVNHPISPAKVMIAGIHDPLEYERDFIKHYDIATCSPQQVKSDNHVIEKWIKDNEIEYLAIHIDLDVLDPSMFRSVLFAKPGRTKDEFGNVAEGELTMEDVAKLIHEATLHAEAVGITIAEHLPWDAVNLQNFLLKLPLLGNQ